MREAIVSEAQQCLAFNQERGWLGKGNEHKRMELGLNLLGHPESLLMSDPLFLVLQRSRLLGLVRIVEVKFAWWVDLIAGRLG